MTRALGIALALALVTAACEFAPPPGAEKFGPTPEIFPIPGEGQCWVIYGLDYDIAGSPVGRNGTCLAGVAGESFELEGPYELEFAMCDIVPERCLGVASIPGGTHF